MGRDEDLLFLFVYNFPENMDEKTLPFNVTFLVLGL